VATLGGRIADGMEGIKRLVPVDQKSIGRTPRSNPGNLYGPGSIRFASYSPPPKRHAPAIMTPAVFRFNVPKARCETCAGEGFVMVELLFLRAFMPLVLLSWNSLQRKTLEIKYRDQSIADVLGMTVDAAWEFFGRRAACHRCLDVLREVGWATYDSGSCHRALRRRGTADQACDRVATHAARDTLYSSTNPRLDCIRPMSRSSWPNSMGWSKQAYGHRGGARYASRSRQRLGYRRWVRRGG